MTDKEAIEVIRKELYSLCESSGIDCFNSDCENCKTIVAYEKAINALEKRIAKNIISPTNPKKDHYKCPTCKNPIDIDDDDLYVYGIEPPKCCNECGQALIFERKDTKQNEKKC